MTPAVTCVTGRTKSHLAKRDATNLPPFPFPLTAVAKQPTVLGPARQAWSWQGCPTRCTGKRQTKPRRLLCRNISTWVLSQLTQSALSQGSRGNIPSGLRNRKHCLSISGTPVCSRLWHCMLGDSEQNPAEGRRPASTRPCLPPLCPTMKCCF